MPTPDDDPTAVNPQKLRTGWSRLWHAAGYSMAGLRAGWGEKAFRLEAIVSLVMLPLAFWLARSWVEGALLAGTVILVMVVELLNTAIESAIDRTGAEWHPLSKRAKDLGSAAVFLSLVLAVGVWTAALVQRLAQTA